jgi:hypothetical protein
VINYLTVEISVNFNIEPYLLQNSSLWKWKNVRYTLYSYSGFSFFRNSFCVLGEYAKTALRIAQPPWLGWKDNKNISYYSPFRAAFKLDMLHPAIDSPDSLQPFTGWIEMNFSVQFHYSFISIDNICEHYYCPVFRIRIHLIRIWIQHFRLNTDPDPGFCWPKMGKNLQLKIHFVWIKIYNLRIPRPPKRKSKIQKKLSALKREHPAIQNMKFL